MKKQTRLLYTWCHSMKLLSSRLRVKLEDAPHSIDSNLCPQAAVDVTGNCCTVLKDRWMFCSQLEMIQISGCTCVYKKDGRFRERLGNVSRPSAQKQTPVGRCLYSCRLCRRREFRGFDAFVSSGGVWLRATDTRLELQRRIEQSLTRNATRFPLGTALNIKLHWNCLWTYECMRH